MADPEIFPFSPDTTFDLFGLEDGALDALGAGAYVLLRTKDGSFEYPLGSSRIFYIGESRRGESRLATHRYHAGRARLQITGGGRFNSYWWPRYGFAAAFGAEVWWFKARERLCSEALESLLTDRFYRAVGALPVANGQWPNAQFEDPEAE